MTRDARRLLAGPLLPALPAAWAHAQSAMAPAREERSVTPDSAAARIGRLFGVRWTPPAGLRPSTSYTICPLKCALYEGPASYDVRSFGLPAVAVFEPYLGSAEDAIRNWVRARQATSDREFRGISEFRAAASAAGRLVVVTYAEDDRTPASAGVILMALERDGFSVPLVLWGTFRSDLQPRLPAAQAILGSLQVDAAALGVEPRGRHAGRARAAGGRGRHLALRPADVDADPHARRGAADRVHRLPPAVQPHVGRGRRVRRLRRHLAEGRPLGPGARQCARTNPCAVSVMIIPVEDATFRRSARPRTG